MKKTRNIAALGMLIAVTVVLSRFISIKTPFVTLSFGFLPVALAGMLWGPAAGALVGGMGDFIGATLFPTGPYYLGFTVTYALAGLLYGASLCRPRVSRLRLWLTCTAVNIAVYFALDSLWLYDIMGAGLFAMLGKRLLKNVVMIPVSALILAILLRRRDELAKPFITADKKQARREAAVFWGGFTGETRSRISADITARVLALPQLQAADTVFCYCGTEGEVDTAQLIAALLAMGKRVALPRCEEDGTMTARAVSDITELEAGRFGIPAPKAQAETVQPHTISLVLLPGLSFDRVGTRLGKGKAYYDRFLQACAAPRVGLCPEGALRSRLPFMATDMPMDYVVSERRTLRCR